VCRDTTQGEAVDEGSIVLTDTAEALLADERMAELYLGHGPEEPPTSRSIQ
jgi:hypothetical protein